MTLKRTLEQVHRRFAGHFLANDPLEYPRRFAAPEDREIAAFISAALAYGRVAMIRRNLDDLFRRMDGRPAEFVGNFDPVRDLARLESFRHRFNSGFDVACLCLMLQKVLLGWGGLEAFFLAGDEEKRGDIGEALSSFVERALAFDLAPLFPGGRIPPRASVRYFLPSPARGSACKRLCMFLRWAARPDDGVDLGLWGGVSPARLVMPLDTHTARISRLLGLSRRRTADWKMALEVTAALRRLDPDDPVRFDFALSHLGISEGCSGKAGEVCVACPVAGLCVTAEGGEE